RAILPPLHRGPGGGVGGWPVHQPPPGGTTCCPRHDGGATGGGTGDGAPCWGGRYCGGGWVGGPGAGWSLGEDGGGCGRRNPQLGHCAWERATPKPHRGHWSTASDLLGSAVLHRPADSVL